MRFGLYLVLFFIVFNNGMANAALKYQQDLTISRWTSLKDVEESVQEFCEAAEGDPDIKVIKVSYKQTKKRGDIMYSATIICYVSKIDEDLMRINGKAFQKKYLCGNTQE